MKALCVGEMLIDFLPGSEKDSYIRRAGGAPANVAIALARQGCETAFCGMLGADDFGRFLARAGAEQRFTLSCMAFQDALSLDVERVRGCCIHVVRPDGRMIPFCLHNLTSTEGRMLYPQRLACGEEGHDGI